MLLEHFTTEGHSSTMSDISAICDSFAISMHHFFVIEEKDIKKN
jgi:hypothetical protein